MCLNHLPFQITGTVRIRDINLLYTSRTYSFGKSKWCPSLSSRWVTVWMRTTSGEPHSEELNVITFWFSPLWWVDLVGGEVGGEEGMREVTSLLRPLLWHVKNQLEGAIPVLWFLALTWSLLKQQQCPGSGLWENSLESRSLRYLFRFPQMSRVFFMSLLFWIRIEIKSINYAGWHFSYVSFSV